jgi:mono/diheme cytochrome c family protein
MQPTLEKLMRDIMNGALRCLPACLLVCVAVARVACGEERVERDLLVLYDFEERSGTVVHDRSDVAPPLDLQIEKPSAARWRNGALVVTSSAAIGSAKPAGKIIDAVRKSGELTIEAWVKPENDKQAGPARIVSLSADPSRRNFTLGQDAARYDVRLRTTTTDQNGIPSTPSSDKALSSKLTHVVYARDVNGQARIFIDGKENATKQVPGELSNWLGEFRLLLANELTGDRPWLGELHLVAVYGRALTAEEVAGNFAAGSGDGWELAALLPPAADRRVDFVKDVQPIFRAHCFKCHARDEEKGGLNLGRRARAMEGGKSGPVLTSGESAGSRLIHLVAAIDKDAVMPPEGERLTREQVGVLRAWIDQGLAWPTDADVLEPRLEQARAHWAFQPLRAVEPPAVKSAEWVRAPIDRFILAALEAKGLQPTPPIDAGRLIRRVSFDLAGLPPDPADVERFRGDMERDRQAAVAALVDRLLASRHYGERWGRHWLDVARYADSDGMENDADRPYAYRYRDFVIQALNDDMPYDTFVRWQIAGDEIEPDNLQAAAATGFLTAGPSQFLEEKYLEEERLRNRYNELDDILSTLGTGILGLTLGCARCHDHKYDAVPSREYYRMLSALHSGDRKQVKIGPDGTEALVFRDFGGDPRTTWLFARGNFYDRDHPVQLGFLDVLSRDRTAADYWTDAPSDRPRTDTTYQRTALAVWITDVDHGAGALAARVIVNRVWQHHFGEGLVRTVSDFGVRGEPPTHPELLEWLAHDFVTHGWKLKRLHRMIVTSAVYQQGTLTRRVSEGTEARRASEGIDSDFAASTIDPDNRLLGHRTPQRLEAEILRDAILATSGTLNLEPFGPAFKPPIPAEAMQARNTKDPYPKDAKDDASTRRRSVYMFHKRVVPYPLLQAFDRPDAQQACGRRDQTTVAPQGLALLNDTFVRARSVDFANRLLRETDDDDRLIDRTFQLALARSPTAAERAASLEFLKTQAAKRHSRDPGKPAAEARVAAATDFCQTVFSLNEFIYVD